MEPSLKRKSESQRQASGTILTIVIFVIGVVSYFAIPFIHVFLSRALVGWKGLLYLLGAGILLTLWFLYLGFRGKSILYALMILVFAILCIWMAVNFDLIWNSMEASLGIWPTILIAVLGGIGVWLFIRFYL